MKAKGLKFSLLSIAVGFIGLIALAGCGGNSGYTVTYANPDGTVLGTEQVQFDQYAELPTTYTKTGHSFIGWYSNKSLTVPYTPTPIDTDITLYARFDKNTYVITFDSKGGSPVAPISALYESVITPENPVKDSYTFMGWYTTEQFVTLFDNKVPAYNMTVYAKWDANSSVVTFDSNSYGLATGTMAKQTIFQDGAVETLYLSKNNYQWEGHQFVAWNTKADGTGIIYTDQQKITSVDALGKEVTLYAQWSTNEYKAHFMNDASEFKSLDVSYGDIITPIQDHPSKVGYDFVGWGTPTKTTDSTVDRSKDYFTAKADGSFVVTTATDATLKDLYEIQVRDSFTVGTSDLVIYAKFVKQERTLSLVDSVTQTPIKTVQGYIHDVVTLEEQVQKEGYTNIGWYSDPELKNYITSYTFGSEDGTIYSGYKINQYTLTFVNDQVSTKVSGDYNSDISSKLPETPTKVGYIFEGWYLDSSFAPESKVASLPSKMPADNLTYYAKFVVKSNTISFDSNGGSSVASIVANFNESISAPANPTKEGYTFGGWLVKGSETQYHIPEKMPADSVELVAKWNINSYKIYFDSNGGSSVDAATVTYKENTVAPNEPTKAHYVFAGWFESGVLFEFGKEMPAHDIQLEARWDCGLTDVNVIYLKQELNGAFSEIGRETKQGTIEGEFTISESVANAYLASSAEVEKEGLVFDSSTTVSKLGESGNEVTVKFVRKSYTVTVKNSLDVSIVEISRKYNENIGDLAKTYARPGYSATFTVDGEAATKDTPITKACDAVITYTPLNNTINYDAKGGLVNGEVTYVENVLTNADIPEVTATKDGYTFAGWFYVKDDQPFTLTKMPAESLSVYAKWTPANTNVKIVANLKNIGDGYTATEGFDPVVALTESFLTLTADTAPVIPGFTFESSQTITVPGKDGVINVYYTRNTYSVKFYNIDNKEEELLSTTRLYEQTIGSVEISKTGYHLDHFEDKDEQLISDISAVQVNGDTVIYVKLVANQYNVYFNATSGSFKGIKESKIENTYKETIVTPTENPTRLGYEFVGWFTKDGSTSGDWGEELSVAYPTTPAQDITVYAKWNAVNVNYTIQYREITGLSTSELIESEVKSGLTDSVIPTATSATAKAIYGFTFDSAQSDIVIKADGTTIYYIYYTRNTYTVTVKNNLDATTDSFDRLYQAEVGDLETIYAKPGYSMTFTVDGEAATKTTKITKASEVMLNYVALNNTINYDAKGGVVKGGATYVENVLTDATIPEVTATKDGYTFAGWFYVKDDQPFTLTKMPAENLSVYAKWTPASTTVKIACYLHNLGNDEYTLKVYDVDPTTTATTESELTLTAATAPEIYGFTFESSETITVPGINGVIKVYYTRNTYTVNFYNADNKTELLKSVDRIYEQTIGSVDVTKSGYTFAQFEDKDGVAISDITVISVTGDTNIYVKFTANKYNITYNATAGNFKGNPTFVIPNTYEQAIVLPSENPTRVGYEFVDWYIKDGSTSGDWGDKLSDAYSTTPLNGLTVYAKWNAITVNYTVQYREITGVSESSLISSEVKTGLTDSVIPTATAETKAITGFTFASAESGITINGDGSTIYVIYYTRNSYEVKFIYNSSEVAKKDVAYDSLVMSSFDSFDLAGYDTHYYDGETEITSSISTLKVPANALTIRLVYTGKPYTATFDANDGTFTGGKTSIEKVINAGQSVVSDENPTREGYDFKGWYSVSESKDADKMPINNATFTAKWEKKEYTLTLDYNYAMAGGQTRSEQVLYADSYELPTPTREGYAFDGWFYDNETFLNKVADNTVVMGAANKTVYAKWTLKEVTVNYNGGQAESGSMASLTIKYTDLDPVTKEYALPTTLEEGTFVKPGYKFAGWYTKKDEKEVDITVIKASDFEKSSNPVTVYAKWVVDEFEITFNSNGGTDVTGIIANYGTAISRPASPTKTNYSFAGWFTKDGTVSGDWGEMYVFTTMPPQDIELHAKWIINNYKIKFVTGTTQNIDDIAVDAGTKLTAEYDRTPDERPGYEFGGWKKLDGSEIKTLENVIMPDEDLILTAVWTPVKCTINFYVNGSIDKTITEDFGSPIDLYEPTGTGVFIGWFTKDGTGNDWGDLFTSKTMPLGTEKVTNVYARFETGTVYTVNYCDGETKLFVTTSETGLDFIEGIVKQYLVDRDLYDYVYQSMASIGSGDTSYFSSLVALSVVYNTGYKTFLSNITEEIYNSVAAQMKLVPSLFLSDYFKAVTDLGVKYTAYEAAISAEPQVEEDIQAAYSALVSSMTTVLGYHTRMPNSFTTFPTALNNIAAAFAQSQAPAQADVNVAKLYIGYATLWDALPQTAGEALSILAKNNAGIDVDPVAAEAVFTDFQNVLAKDYSALYTSLAGFSTDFASQMTAVGTYLETALGSASYELGHKTNLDDNTLVSYFSIEMTTLDPTNPLYKITVTTKRGDEVVGTPQTFTDQPQSSVVYTAFTNKLGACQDYMNYIYQFRYAERGDDRVFDINGDLDLSQSTLISLPSDCVNFPTIIAPFIDTPFYMVNEEARKSAIAALTPYVVYATMSCSKDMPLDMPILKYYVNHFKAESYLDRTYSEFLDYVSVTSTLTPAQQQSYAQIIASYANELSKSNGEKYQTYKAHAYVPYVEGDSAIFDGWVMTSDATKKEINFEASWVNKVTTPITNLHLDSTDKRNATFTWDAVSGAYAYRVVVNKVVGDIKTTLTKGTTTIPTFTVTDLTNSETIEVNVYAMSMNATTGYIYEYSKVYSATDLEDATKTVYYPAMEGGVQKAISLGGPTSSVSYTHINGTDIDVDKVGDYYYANSEQKKFYLFCSTSYSFGGKTITLKNNNYGVTTNSSKTSLVTSDKFTGLEEDKYVEFALSDNPTLYYKAYILPLPEKMNLGTSFSKFNTTQLTSTIDPTSAQGKFLASEGSKKAFYVGKGEKMTSGTSIYSYSDYQGVVNYEGIDYSCFNGVKFDFDPLSTAGNTIGDFAKDYSFVLLDKDGKPTTTFLVEGTDYLYDDAEDVVYFLSGADKGSYRAIVAPKADDTKDSYVNVCIPNIYKNNVDKMAKLSNTFDFVLGDGINIYSDYALKLAFRDFNMTTVNIQKDIEGTYSPDTVAPIDIYTKSEKESLLPTFHGTLSNYGDVDITPNTAVMSETTTSISSPLHWSKANGKADAESHNVTCFADKNGDWYYFNEEGTYCIASCEWTSNRTGGHFKVVDDWILRDKYDFHGYTPCGGIYYRFSIDFEADNKTPKYTGNFNVNGNYFTLDASKVPFEVSNAKVNSLEVAPRYDIQMVSMAVVKNRSATVVNVSNLNIVGNTENSSKYLPTSEGQDVTAKDIMEKCSGGLNGLNGSNSITGICEPILVSQKSNEWSQRPGTGICANSFKDWGKINVESVNVSNTLIGLYTDTSFNISYSNISNSWANGIYGATIFADNINVDHTIVQSSGGAAIHIEDKDYFDVKGEDPITDGSYNTSLNMDYSSCYVTNFVSGSEQWFKAYTMEIVAITIKSLLEQTVSSINPNYTVIKQTTDPSTGLVSDSFNWMFFSMNNVGVSDKNEADLGINLFKDYTNTGIYDEDSGNYIFVRTVDLPKVAKGEVVDCIGYMPAGGIAPADPSQNLFMQNCVVTNLTINFSNGAIVGRGRSFLYFHQEQSGMGFISGYVEVFEKN